MKNVILAVLVLAGISNSASAGGIQFVTGGCATPVVQQFVAAPVVTHSFVQPQFIAAPSFVQSPVFFQQRFVASPSFVGQRFVSAPSFVRQRVVVAPVQRQVIRQRTVIR